MEKFKEVLNTYLKGLDTYARECSIGDIFSYDYACQRFADHTGYDIKLIETEGGGEGEGEYCYGIISFQDKYFKAEWSYYSYDGCDYDDIEDTIREVKPVQRLVTFYE